MIVLVPVSRYRVRYQVASGRPYSFFEQLVLEAVQDGHSSLDTLEQTFRVHRRTLIEGVVTLIQAGWVVVDKNTHALMPTKAGLNAIATPDEVPRNVVITNQTDFIIGERVQGQVAKGSEVTFRPRSEFRKHLSQVAVLASCNIPHPLDPGILAHLLRKEETEWIRSCGPIDIVRDGADYAVADVDTSVGTITGIPLRWVALLRNELIERARTKERQMAEEGVVGPPDTALARLVHRDFAAAELLDLGSPDEWHLEPSQDRFIINDAHRSLLTEWLETAHSYVGIVGGPLDSHIVETMSAALLGAIERGVIIDVLWSAPSPALQNDSHSKAFEALRKIEWNSHHNNGRGRLTLSRRPVPSNARLILADVSDSFETVVGSFDWLGCSERRQTDLSVHFRERGPVARIARLVADLAAGDPTLSTGIGLTRVRRAAADLDRQTAEAAERRLANEHEEAAGSEGAGHDYPSTGDLRARIIVGRQHHAILPELAREAKERLVVACATWGSYSDVSFTSLADALKAGCRNVDVYYGHDTGDAALHGGLADALKGLGGNVKRIPEMHARLAVADSDTLAITSFDWLHPDPDRPLSTASDIGFILSGDGVGSVVIDRLGLTPAVKLTPVPADYITGFRIKSIRSVDQVTWQIGESEGPGWHVLVGENGTGKTSILRALALALMGADSARALREDWNTWIRFGSAAAQVDITIGRLDSSAPVPVQRDLRNISMSWSRDSSTTLIQGPASPEPTILSAGYGPFRRFNGDPEYEKALASVPDAARHFSLFDERVGLTECIAWLRGLRFRDLEGDAESTFLLKRLTELINSCGLLPWGITLAEITSERVTFKGEDGSECVIEELSDGYRSVLCLTLDIIRQLVIRFGAAHLFDPEQPNCVVAPCVIFVDEIDAHLHPRWQRTIGQWLREHFPRTQFIVTTHSILVCQAAEKGSIFCLPDPADEGDTGRMLEGADFARVVYGSVLEAYSSGAFGDEVTRSESAQTMLDRLAELNLKELRGGLSEDERQEQDTLRVSLPLEANSV